MLNSIDFLITGLLGNLARLACIRSPQELWDAAVSKFISVELSSPLWATGMHLYDFQTQAG